MHADAIRFGPRSNTCLLQHAFNRVQPAKLVLLAFAGQGYECDLQRTVLLAGLNYPQAIYVSLGQEGFDLVLVPRLRLPFALFIKGRALLVLDLIVPAYGLTARQLSNQIPGNLASDTSPYDA